MPKFDSRSILYNAVTSDNGAIMDVRNAGVWHTLESYLGRFIGIDSITEINLQDTNREQNYIKRYNNNGNR